MQIKFNAFSGSLNIVKLNRQNKWNLVEEQYSTFSKYNLFILTFPSLSNDMAATPCLWPSLSMETVWTSTELHTQMKGSLPTWPVATNTLSGWRARLKQGKCDYQGEEPGWNNANGIIMVKSHAAIRQMALSWWRARLKQGKWHYHGEEPGWNKANVILIE